MILNSDLESKTHNEREPLNCNSHVEKTPEELETVWVEGLVPGIDFCNHGNSYS